MSPIPATVTPILAATPGAKQNLLCLHAFGARISSCKQKYARSCNMSAIIYTCTVIRTFETVQRHAKHSSWPLLSKSSDTGLPVSGGGLPILQANPTLRRVSSFPSKPPCGHMLPVHQFGLSTAAVHSCIADKHSQTPSFVLHTNMLS